MTQTRDGARRPKKFQSRTEGYFTKELWKKVEKQWWTTLCVLSPSSSDNVLAAILTLVVCDIISKRLFITMVLVCGFGFLFLCFRFVVSGLISERQLIHTPT